MTDEFSAKQLNQLRSVVVEGIGEAFEHIVLPRLATIEDDVGTLKTSASAQGEQLDRIERKLNATVIVTDHFETRLKSLETKLAT